MDAPFSEIQQEQCSREADEKRPLAERTYIRELAEINGKKDGAYVHELFAKIEDELQTMMLVDNANKRDIAMMIAKAKEAELWAIEYQRKKGIIHVLDRRRFMEDK